VTDSRPPFPEAEGFRARAGFVKADPRNNDYYVEQFEGHPWYPIIKRTHDRLTELIPGYNILQIKEKFGGLRYYIRYPEVIPIKPEFRAYDSEEKIKGMVDRILTFAEGWVEGYEAEKEENK
jgi:hypothetical protein